MFTSFAAQKSIFSPIINYWATFVAQVLKKNIQNFINT